MATTNQERIGRGLALLARGLEPRVVKALETAYGPNWWDVVDQQAVEATGRGVGTNTSDPAFLLNAVWHHWNHVFGKVLGKTERSYVSELQEVRNRWAHPRTDRPFTLDDTDRALGTMGLVLEAFAAPDAAGEVRRLRDEVLRQRWENEERREAKRAAPAPATSATTGLRPWRTIAQPHRDVREGRYVQAEFAANLSQAARGDGPAEYADPALFYQRTFITAGLTDLLEGALRRLSGTGGEPVIELQTTFGGGKTHSMIALHHLAASKEPASLAGVEPILQTVGLDRMPRVTTAVLSGLDLSPAEPKSHDGTQVRTMWGELAWQLGGHDAFDRLARSDAAGKAPGVDILRDLFTAYGPVLILIDEWVTFIRQLWTDASLPAGSFDDNLSFAHQLTEAAKQTKDSLLVASLPSSEIETGGEGGHEALRRLRHTFGRIQAPWQPATAEESFQIVKNRLFEPVGAADFAARDAAISAFASLYRGHSGDFPAETKETAYERRMRDAYPIHPELFDRLYADWSSLERFQRTRGVLRLMAAVIHRLWESEDQSPLILPASVPISEGSVRTELLRYLEDNWKPVVDTDVDGSDSLPWRLDAETAALGRYLAARRVARTVFLGSAPTAPDAPNRGLDDRTIKLGAVQPGESPATFGDALRRLSNRATHLYDNQGRYWFSTEESVAQLARDRTERVTDDETFDEIRYRLRSAARERDAFARVHVAPQLPADVADEDDVALVVLGPEVPHTIRSEASAAGTRANEILNERGTGPRQHRNMLVFLAPDQSRLTELMDAARQYLAWKSIDADRDTLTLDSFQQRQLTTKLAEADGTVTSRIPETYSWLLVPSQPQADGAVEWKALRLTGSDGIVRRAARKLVGDDLLLPKCSGTYLRFALDNGPPRIWESGEVGVRQLWSYFTSYLYMPRLASAAVFADAIADGVGSAWRDTFAYAAGKDEAAGRYLGLIVARHLDVVLDGRSLIVRPELAAAQLEREEAERAASSADIPSKADVPTTGAGTEAVVPSGPRPMRRFHGTVDLDATRPTPQFSQVAEEVVARLAGLSNARVRVRVDIEATADSEGFTDSTVRTVTENAHTLKFTDAGFEEE